MDRIRLNMVEMSIDAYLVTRPQIAFAGSRQVLLKTEAVRAYNDGHRFRVYGVVPRHYLPLKTYDKFINATKWYTEAALDDGWLHILSDRLIDELAVAADELPELVKHE